ncbi:MAG TPA: indolepyruvate oxidoreductase subunit beta [Thermoanaerobacterales bacterium]|uniref:indolepyruvate oxidoreductase subunit beta n=1 Tax=Tepidanaerobacter sp. GT38 TaxID=2722793 RepID=UPI0018381BE3|nr:indolepyruvate oxidoreductase subunit beta [Tepidanaerobacter sp. GT38]MCG1013120.1 indolepyruvate oxidoreductase subunit beta [Tepidanaerobacter sp. GT38]HHY41516.1 indolepyruvate oxidoreductase subunit beta [Thermoanaerobacterales bacterium]
MTKSLLLAGVGGQGTILASKILAEGLIRLGYDVKMSEIHGMAQRGGSVNTQLRFGKKVYSPMIGSGEADLLLAFEKIEAVRYINYLRPGGILIVNDYEIYSTTVLTGQEKYPDDVLDKLKHSVENTIVINAAQIAGNLGNIRAHNMVLLGAAVKQLGIMNVNWQDIIKAYLPEKFHEVNLKAFEEGTKQPKL